MLVCSFMDGATKPWRPDDTFASRLIQVRRQLGLSQREIAEKAGLSAASWAGWELGSLPRDVSSVAKSVAGATGCDLSWLLFGGEAVAS